LFLTYYNLGTVTATQSSDDDDLEDNLPPVSKRMIDNMIRSGVKGSFPDGRGKSVLEIDREMEEEDGDNEIFTAEEGRANKGNRRDSSIEDLQEKAMFEEVIGEVRPV